MSAKLKSLLLVLGDVIVFYLSLFAMLLIRYGSFSSATMKLHLFPFTIGLIFWLLLFYISDLYDLKFLKNSSRFLERYSTVLVIAALILVLLYYFTPSFSANAPKRNLLLFMILFGLISCAWRFAMNQLLGKIQSQRILLLGSGKSQNELVHYLSENPQLGYDIVPAHESKTAAVAVVPAQLTDSRQHQELARRSLRGEITLIRLSDFYEHIFKRVPLEDLEQMTLVEAMQDSGRGYQAVRRSLEILVAVLLLIIMFPLFVLFSILVPLTSSGPVLYVQTRVGLHGKPFRLYKFRSMYSSLEKNPDADSSSPTWTTQGDPRITPFGKILRMSHLDELPQLINIIRGDMSFIGPRPGRPLLDEKLEREIPYYSLRYFISPGLSGWAQINFGYGASIEDEQIKLQYDMYYLKHRSLGLDVSIFLKTLKKLVS